MMKQMKEMAAADIKVYNKKFIYKIVNSAFSAARKTKLSRYEIIVNLDFRKRYKKKYTKKNSQKKNSSHL